MSGWRTTCAGGTAGILALAHPARLAEVRVLRVEAVEIRERSIVAFLRD